MAEGVKEEKIVMGTEEKSGDEASDEEKGQAEDN